MRLLNLHLFGVKAKVVMDEDKVIEARLGQLVSLLGVNSLKQALIAFTPISSIGMVHNTYG